MKMNSKNGNTRRTYPYYGLGFRVILTNVPMIKIYGEWVPDVNFSEIEDRMSVKVPLKSARLTGYEVRFLRRHMNLTMDDLAKLLDVTRQIVIQWEKCGDEPTKMETSNERVLRLLALDAGHLPAGQYKKAVQFVLTRTGRTTRPGGRKFSLSPTEKSDRRSYVTELLAG